MLIYIYIYKFIVKYYLMIYRIAYLTLGGIPPTKILLGITVPNLGV